MKKIGEIGKTGSIAQPPIGARHAPPLESEKKMWEKSQAKAGKGKTRYSSTTVQMPVSRKGRRTRCLLYTHVGVAGYRVWNAQRLSFCGYIFWPS